MKKTLFKLHFVLLLGLFVAGCTKPDPPEPPYIPPKPFDWDTYDWKHSFFCHSPITISDSVYFHGFLDGKEVCIVSGKDGYEYRKDGTGLVTTSLGYRLAFSFGHKSKDSVCLLYLYSPPRPTFATAIDYFSYFQLGDLPIMDRDKVGFSLDFEVTYNVKEDGHCSYRLFPTDLGSQDSSVFRLVEKSIIETPNSYIFYFKIEMDIVLYDAQKADSLGYNPIFGHIKNGVLAYKTEISK
jgi:hypothetical protein